MHNVGKPPHLIRGVARGSPDRLRGPLPLPVHRSEEILRPAEQGELDHHRLQDDPGRPYGHQRSPFRD
jgi:hypothetical protein